jgi:hypothetical protein
MLLYVPVPPSKRQAAGPLTENLPNVLVCGPETIGDQLSSPVVTAKQANFLPYEPSMYFCFAHKGFLVRTVASAMSHDGGSSAGAMDAVRDQRGDLA